jgi:hypothetical protein
LGFVGLGISHVGKISTTVIRGLKSKLPAEPLD